ncbi:MAG: hypothetical protein V4548_10580 [Bacteroidota bacterium]
MQEIDKQKILKAFPKEIEKDVAQVITLLSERKFEIHPEVSRDIIINNEKLSIPERLYFDEIPNSEIVLSDLQSVILNCLCLSHHDGYIRQRSLEKLNNRKEYFIMPFVFQVLGEYIIEILEVLERQINENTISNYQKFIVENPSLWQKTEKRIVSYWNVYYRSKYPKLKDYVGTQIIKKIKSFRT